MNKLSNWINKTTEIFVGKMRGLKSFRNAFSTLYWELEIPEFSGSFKVDKWTVRPDSDVNFIGNSLVCRGIELLSDRVCYLVGNGTDLEFTKLSGGSGISVEGSSGVRITLDLVARGNVQTRLVLAEFDAAGARIGELVFENGSNSTGSFLKETRYVLPALRFKGKGEVQFQWLDMHLLSETNITAKSRIQPAKSSSRSTYQKVLNSSAAQIQNHQKQLKAISDELKHVSLRWSSLAGIQSEVGIGNASIPGSKEAGLGDLEKSKKIFLNLASQIPTSNGSQRFEKIPLSVGIITDEYMFNFYKDVFETVTYLSPANLSGKLKSGTMDLVIYVSCWKGLEGEEWKGIKYREGPASALEAILDFCHKNNIPSIFQSIEDPSNYEYFLPIARKFDYVFTSDADLVDRYREDLRHDRVYYGEYGANPLINNPIGSWRIDLPCAFFAGSYPNRYPERLEDMETIFDSIPDREDHLVILDRNYGNPDYAFPKKYDGTIFAPLPHDVLQNLHKIFRYSLNFNSIKHSSTMCAMRIYELQDHGLPIISNYSKSVLNKFPEIRLICRPATIAGVLADRISLVELAVANKLMIDIINKRSSWNVVNEMLSKVGFDLEVDRPPKVLVITTHEDLDSVQRMALKQLDVQAVVVEESQFDHKSLRAFDYFTRMSSSYHYDPNYLAGKIAAFVYTNSQFVTQNSFFEDGHMVEGIVHEYVESATNACMTVVPAGSADGRSFICGETSILLGRGYSNEPFGIGFDEYISRRSDEQCADEPKLTVIIPVYNNGRFLLGKCIPSLMRNKSFGQMEIILVDDGSDDEITLAICRRLSVLMKNVRLYSFDDGGSGTASRPRNKGIELARTEWLTFLDPDNEISDSGYDNLLRTQELFSSRGIESDFVSGFQIKVGEKVTVTGRHARGNAHVVENALESFFIKGNFPVVSTQAAIIRKAILSNNQISFVEKAAGQDTLFGWETLLSSANPIFVDSAYLVYYAERGDSVTNTVTPDYFSRCRLLEESQVKVLEKFDVLETYKKSHLKNFVTNWYLERLNRMDEDDKPKGLAEIERICELYGQSLNDLTKD